MFDFDKIKEVLSDKFVLKTKDGQIKKKDLAYIPRRNDAKVQKALLDIDANHNHSWFDEIYQRNINHLNSTALFYRGNEISYAEMFNHMLDLAKSLKSYGLKKGDEIPICLSNTPELIYIMGAASIIGAKINVFGPKFDEEYVTKILNGTKSSILFIEDNNYERLRNSIKNSGIKDIIMISLSDSLTHGIHPLDMPHKSKFENKIDQYKDDNIKTFFDFLHFGVDYQGTLSERVGLDDEFSITYTSGSTNAKHPKQIVHSNRSFIMMGRHHDKDMSGGIDMKKFTFQAHLPTYSNTDLISCISDSLMQGSRIALEPISDKDFFVNTLIINQPHCVIATTSYWIQAMKEILYNPEYRNVSFPNLLLAFGAGEPMSVNEEFFLNKGLRKSKAGTSIIPSFLRSTVMSAGGGDCEHGSIFYGILRRLYERKKSADYYEEAGNKLSDFAELAVLDQDGHYCSKGEYGRVVANSGCSMEYYKDDPEATKRFFIQDAYGKTWGDCNVYGFVDKKNRVHIKGRIPKDKEVLPTFLINDEVLKDQKNVLSALTVRVADNDDDNYVVHFERMPESNKSSLDIMREALLRIRSTFGENVSSHVYFREHSFEESFPLTGSGKRNQVACQEEGISDKTVQIDLEKNPQLVLKK